MSGVAIRRVFAATILAGLTVTGDSSLFSSQAPQCATVPAGLVSWYSGDGHAQDERGTNHGARFGGASFAPGMVNDAFHFGGNGDFIEVPHHPSLDPVGSFTVDAWIRTAQRTGVQMIVSKYECGRSCPPGASSSIYSLYVEDGRLAAHVRDSFGHGLDGLVIRGQDVADGAFHHVALVRDTAANRGQLYVDGALSAELELGPGSDGPLADGDGEPDPFVVGAIVQGGASNRTNFFNGQLDEVGFFDRALPASEIQDTFAAGSLGRCRTCAAPAPQMVSWYPAEGDAVDVQGPTFEHGTLHDNAGFGRGKVGQAFDFDGVDDSVRLPADESQDIHGAFTAEAWIFPRTLPNLASRILDKDDNFGNRWLMTLDNFGSFSNSLTVGINGLNNGVNGFLVSTPNGSILLNVWTHVAFSYSEEGGTGTVKVFINGALAASASGNPQSTNVGAPLIIGDDSFADRDISDRRGFDGLIDEVSIYQTALPEQDILRIFQAGRSGKCRAIEPLQIAPTEVTIGAGETQTFTAAGGLAPYLFSIQTNNSHGTIDVATGLYIAGPAIGGVDVVRVTDSLGSAVTAAVTVHVGRPHRLAFRQGATTTVAGAMMTPAVKVAIEDRFGNLVSTAVDSVTIAIGHNPGSSTLSGTLTRDAAGGLATFDDLTLDRTGTGYTLEATSAALAAATSNGFNVTAAAASQLAFAVQPGTSGAGQVIAPAIEVSIRDRFGNLVPTATQQVALALGTNPTGAALTGTRVRAATSGVARFNDLRVDRGGAGYTLVASSASLSPATSAAFDVLHAVLVVTNTNDGGPGSLSAAIDASNATAGIAETIRFNIAGAPPFRIPLRFPLLMFQSVVIDGTTQPGFAGTPLIEIAASPTALSGLVVFSAGSTTIRGLAVNGFQGVGISLEGNGGHVVEACYIGTDTSGSAARGNNTGVWVSSPGNRIGGFSPGTRNIISGNTSGIVVSGVAGSSANSNVIRGNLIGTDATGSAAIGNVYGIGIVSAPNNTVGGLDPAARNVISGNGFGVVIEGAGADGNQVIGNVIGTNAAGIAGVGNQFGVLVGGGRDNAIGGATPQARNVISGNTADGIAFFTLFLGISPPPTRGTRVQGNLIGVQADGASPLANGGNGIVAYGGFQVSDTLVGGLDLQAANRIAFNGGTGVAFCGAAENASGNRIRGNAIFGNAWLGIDIDCDGPDANDVGFPSLSSIDNGAAGSTITGTLNRAPNTEYTLEFFSNPPSVGCNRTGFGEGYTLIGVETVTTDAEGAALFNVAFAAPIALGTSITATATDPTGNTSEFSQCRTFGYEVTTTDDEGPGSLRQALVNANTVGTTGVVSFNIPGAGAQTIRPLSALPPVSAPVIIDGTTQPGFAGSPIVELDGTTASAANADGLLVTGGNAWIRGLVINRFTGPTAAGIRLQGSGGHGVDRSYIGTDLSGSASAGNRIGIVVESSGNAIGFFGVGLRRTVISGNLTDGVQIAPTASGNRLSSLAIGTNPFGDTAVPNGTNGVLVLGTDNTVELAQIASNGGHGALIAGDRNILIRNVVGIRRGNDAAPLPNGGDGVRIQSGVGNALNANAISGNAGLGINLGNDGVTANDAGDADAGPNGLQNFPVLTSAGSTSFGTIVEGTINGVASTTLRLEFFSSPACDASGHGEGRRWIGSTQVTTDAGGNAVFSANLGQTVAAGDIITATATDPANNTSEFSRCESGGAWLLVVNANDSGPGSLRQAILDANATTVPATIRFSIPGAGPHTIRPASALPDITRPVVIDGTTQPGFAGRPIIELDGSNAGPSADGLRIATGSSTVRGLVVNRFGGANAAGIRLMGAGNAVERCYIGTDLNGSAALPNTIGIAIAAGATASRIGGSAAGHRNLVSGNVTGLTIAGSGDIVQGNLIGVAADGVTPLANGRGVIVSGNGSNNIIGGPGTGAGNVIKFSSLAHGVEIASGVGNMVRGNAIAGNAGLGINLGADELTRNDGQDRDSGANNLQNFPKLTSVSVGALLTVRGGLDSARASRFMLDFYANDQCDSSGHGEGQTFLGSAEVTTARNGILNFTVTLPASLRPGQFVTATATDDRGNTSEFSNCQTAKRQ